MGDLTSSAILWSRSWKTATMGSRWHLNATTLPHSLIKRWHEARWKWEWHAEGKQRRTAAASLCRDALVAHKSRERLSSCFWNSQCAIMCWLQRSRPSPPMELFNGACFPPPQRDVSSRLKDSFGGTSNRIPWVKLKPYLSLVWQWLRPGSHKQESPEWCRLH